tara:strand:+ start:1212 stop:1475 length:264 start_codon:yes stop_codon:yes gene_type:complete
MQMKGKKTVEFRLIDSNEMPPIVIKKSEKDNACVIVLNQAHTIWLSLQRNTIPGIVQSLAEKLNQLCDGYLEEQLMYVEMDNFEGDE